MTRGDKYSRRGNQLPKLKIREVLPLVLPCPLGLTVPNFKVREARGSRMLPIGQEGHSKCLRVWQTFLYCSSFFHHSSAVHFLLLAPLERLCIRSLLSGGLY